jgi:hypoxanthine phosphoribosyltransferase
MDINKMKQEVLLSKEEIQNKVIELGKQISKDYEGKPLLVISLLKGSFIFCADLVRHIDLKLSIDFMMTSSYGHSTETTGTVRILKDLDLNIEDYDVLIVDDITDSGITMKEVHRILESRNPKSVKSCVLLDKPTRRQVDYKADYIGFEIPDKFIVGYGLNYGNHYRNVDHVFAFVE